MSAGRDVLLLLRDGGVWGVDNARVLQVKQDERGFRVQIDAAEEGRVLTADEVLGVVRDLPVFTGKSPVRRYWAQPFVGLAVHGGTPLVVVDPDQPPSSLLMTEGETSDGDGRYEGHEA